ncbi:hypothetical protein NHJ13051_006413 [Beauveria bassiana]
MRTDVPPLTTANDWTRLDYLLHHKLFHRNPESATRFRAPSARELFSSATSRRWLDSPI